MKKFTVKDFILYNSPCISCGGAINLYVVSRDSVNPYKNLRGIKYITNVGKNAITVELKITYAERLTLQIIPKSNKFKTSDVAGLWSYLDKHDLYLQSICSECKTIISSNIMMLDKLGGFIHPISLDSEDIMIKDSDCLYMIYTSYEGNSTEIHVLPKDLLKEDFNIKIPLLPIYKFKTKEKLLQKIKTYILFS
jgi:hypothetical protein